MTDIDCVIIGHNEADFPTVYREAKRLQHNSGAFRYLQMNSSLVNGTPMHFMDVVNRFIEEKTGSNPHYSIAELPHLGACYLSSFLQRLQHRTGIVNCFNKDKGDLDLLLKSNPRCVAVTTTLYVDATSLIEVVKYVRQTSASSKIIVGGPYIYKLGILGDDVLRDYTFSKIGADVYVLSAEGELTLSKIVSALKCREASLDAIPNLVLPCGSGKFKATQVQPESNDLDDNRILWDLLGERFVSPTAVTRTARSCAYRCSFCRYPLMAGKLNLMNMDNVEREMRYLNEHGTRQLIIIDDTFNVPLARFKDVCRMIIRNRFDFEWFSYFRCGNADAEAFALMEKSKCGGVFLGIESGDSRILKDMNKKTTVAAYKEGIHRLNEHGIASFACTMTGFPGETEESARHSRELIEESQPTFWRSELYYHDIKAPIHERAREFKIIGAGFSWSHSTMDWRKACDIIEDMYRTVKPSVVTPCWSFDWFAYPFLLGKGVSKSDFLQLSKRAQELMIQSHLSN